MTDSHNLKLHVSRDGGASWTSIAALSVISVTPADFFNLKYKVCANQSGNITIAFPVGKKEGSVLLSNSDWIDAIEVEGDHVVKNNRPTLSIEEAGANMDYEFQLLPKVDQNPKLMERINGEVKVSLDAPDAPDAPDLGFYIFVDEPESEPTIASFYADKLAYLQNETIGFRIDLGYTGNSENLRKYTLKLKLMGGFAEEVKLDTTDGMRYSGTHSASSGTMSYLLELRKDQAVLEQQQIQLRVSDGNLQSMMSQPFLLIDASKLKADRKHPVNNDNAGGDWEVRGFFRHPKDAHHLFAFLSKEKVGHIVRSTDGAEWQRFLPGGQALALKAEWLESPHCVLSDDYLYLIGGSGYRAQPRSNFIKIKLGIGEGEACIEKKLMYNNREFLISGHTLIAHHSQIYLIGGFSRSGVSDAIYSCDPNSGIVTKVATMKMGETPFPICNHQVHVHQGKDGERAYLFGGSSKGFDAGYKKFEDSMYEMPWPIPKGAAEITWRKVEHGVKLLEGQLVTGTGVFPVKQGLVFLAGSRTVDRGGNHLGDFKALLRRSNGFFASRMEIILEGAEYFQFQGEYFKGVVWLCYRSAAKSGTPPLQNKIISFYVG